MHRLNILYSIIAEKAKKYITNNKHTLESNYVYCIRVIEYDRKENNELYETATYRIY